MKKFTKNPNSMHLLQPNRKNPGFALVATLTMMILLSILAVGLLSLSSVALRSSGHGSAQAEARANARMALMVAIGELQNQMGPDQRISANADIMSMTAAGAAVVVPNPNWLGVWDSWIAGDLAEAPVGANYPSAPSHQQTIGAQADITMRPNYANKDRHFRSWLLSLTPAEATNMSSPLAAMLEGERLPGDDDDAVVLVGEGSVGTAASSSFISARLIPVKESSSSDTRGRYAWWVGDESQKARLLNDSYNGQTLTSAQKLLRSQAPASTGTSRIAGLETLTPSEDARLEALPSLKTLDIVPGVEQVTQGGNTYTAAQKNFHSVTPYSYTVLADVREGGLKRDLNTLLERDIDPTEVYDTRLIENFQRPTGYKPEGQSFMLYNFDSLLTSFSNTGMANVPIQDLAAYYQLYDHSRADGGGGIQYSSTQADPPSSLLDDGIMVGAHNYGTTATDYDKFLRGYTSQYRSVKLIKHEIVFHYVTELRDIAAEVAAYIAANPAATQAQAEAALNYPRDRYQLRLGISPSMTFWNPNNTGVVSLDYRSFPGTLNQQCDQSSLTWIAGAMPLDFTFKKAATRGGNPTDTDTRAMSQLFDSAYEWRINTNGMNTLVFGPGETKVVSLQASSLAGGGSVIVDFMNRGGGGRVDNEHFVPELELVPGWNPDVFVRTYENGQAGAAFRTITPFFTFNENDYISVDVTPRAEGFSLSANSTIRQARRPAFGPPNYNFHVYNYASRRNPSASYANDFVYMGFPPKGRSNSLRQFSDPRSFLPARGTYDKLGQGLIDGMNNIADPADDNAQAFFYFGRKAPVETLDDPRSNDMGTGRRFPARPFLHSPFADSAIITDLDGASLYNQGYNWFFKPLSNISDAPISISTNDFGYSGGGQTVENGTTHVVQQQLPLTPPISIAGLSHAILGGHSIATEAPFTMGAYDPVTDSFPTPLEGYRRCTANGFGGLYPKISQAIGNSYAHPNISAGKAYVIANRTYEEGAQTATPFADHSYLANKALWDDYFFSSITPVLDNPIFGSTPLTARQAASNFFFGDAGGVHQPLANRRIQPYMPGLNQAEFDNLFNQATVFQDGLADKIAAHLMVEGAFNINSTSVDAWKALFSSLKGKPVAYYDKDIFRTTGGTDLTEQTPAGVPVGLGALPNGPSYEGSTSDPSDPEQWTGYRELTDEEINELSVAIVKQVKMRGPFLSMSEFINRRLDPSKPTLSKYGALQAAIDDANVSINEGFRSRDRMFTPQEKNFVKATPGWQGFPEALDGAIAYGSPAYVDQSDILRNMAEQLTPRGDTFVIRTYGDSLDADGNVIARAWCEAVVQRTPEYVDSADDPYLKQVDLSSETNKNFGRKFNVVLFRWLNSSEI